MLNRFSQANSANKVQFKGALLMLTLEPKDISLEQTAEDKQAAIKLLASSLEQKGLISNSYVNGMLAREATNSTYLGSGIAIPHGTTETRDQVKQTGVAVHHYPQGVNWGDGNTVYLAIGIAAKSSEHLQILKQLTKVLSMDGAEELIKEAKDAATITNLINGHTQLEIDFDSSLVLENFPVNSMLQLNAVAAGTLQNKNLINKQGLSAALEKEPTYLANGVWLNCVADGAQRSGLCVVKVAEAFEYEDKTVKSLVMVSAANPCYSGILEVLSQQLYQDQLTKLSQFSPQELVACFSQKEAVVVAEDDDNAAVFEIVNPHGLHARPGALLVAEAKKFKANIKVTNLDSETPTTVNAKSLMKVMTLGVKYKDKLQFVAEGEDAPQALQALGAAIAAGLGES